MDAWGYVIVSAVSAPSLAIALEAVVSLWDTKRALTRMRRDRKILAADLEIERILRASRESD